MDLEAANMAGGDATALRSKIEANFSPDQIEQLRAKLYQKAEDGHPEAVRFLRALPTRGAAEQARPREQHLTDDQAGVASGPETSPVPRGTYGDLARQVARTGRDQGLEDSMHHDALTQAIVGGAMTAPVMGPAAATLARAGEGVAGFVGGAGGTAAKAGVKLAGGAGLGAGGAALGGGSPQDIRTGAVFGTMLALPGAGLDVVRDPRLPTGEIYSDLKRAGGTVTPLGARGGMFDTPEYQGLPIGDEGTLEMARRAADKIKPDVEARRVRAKAAIDDAETEASIRNAGKKLPTDEARARAAQLRQGNRDAEGRVLDQPLDRELGKVDEHLTTNRTTKRTEVQRKVDPYYGIERDLPTEVTETTPVSETDFPSALRLKKYLRDQAEPGAPGTPENRPARRISGALSDITRGADPQYDAAAEQYGNETGKLERVNEALVGKGDAELHDTMAQERAMVSNLSRAGVDRLRRPQLLEIADENPTYAPLIESLIARNAAMKLRLGRFGDPAASTTGRVFSTLRGNAEAMGMRALSGAGAASNANYPAIPLEVAAYESSLRRKKLDREAKERLAR